MHLAHPFYRFPFRFDVERLQIELEAVPTEAWCPHPEGVVGNTSLPLISTQGEINDDFEAPLKPTKYLAAAPYMRQVMARFNTLLGRARLMRLEPEAGVPAHIDSHYYWRTHTRVHVPITTHPDIEFHCDGQSVHMGRGEAWTFDSWRMHKVVNHTATWRVHLVFDTLGSAAFWKSASPLPEKLDVQFVPYDPAAEPPLKFETRLAETILCPGDVDCMLDFIARDVAAWPNNAPSAVKTLHDALNELRQDWRATWFGTAGGKEDIAQFVIFLTRAREAVKFLPPETILASNRHRALPVLMSTFQAMINISSLKKSKFGPSGSKA